MKKRWLYTILAGFCGTCLAVLGYSYFSTDAEYKKCFSSLGQKVSKLSDLEATLHTEILKFQILVEESLVARAQILKVHNGLKKRLDQPLTGRDLEVLKAGTEGYLNLRARLYKVAEGYECAIKPPEQFLNRMKIDSALRSKAVMMSLAAALTLYDNYFLAIIAFEKNKSLRRMLNDPDSGFGISANMLTAVSNAAHSVKIRQRVRRVMEFYEADNRGLQVSEKGRQRMLQDDDYIYLNTLINNSPSYNFVRKFRAVTVVAQKLQIFDQITGDFVSEITKDGMDLMSMFFGNTIGMYESRKGKLYGDKKVHRQLTSVLKPLDILLEKTPFRLTDKCIPGHFGHVAIWLGTEAELKELGIWEHPVVKPYHSQLSSKGDPNSPNGNLIVEALRSGVQLSTLEEFLNVDDAAIIRPIAVTEALDEEQRLTLTREALLLAVRQVGKDYDFNFDINTTDKIVCSELAYVSFPSITWPTERVIGRSTISPDNVAQLALTGDVLRLVTFYHDGTLVGDGNDSELALSKMQALLADDPIYD